MILILVESANALRINDKAFERFISATVDQLDRLVPHPKPLSAWIDCGPHAKATILLLLEQNAI